MAETLPHDKRVVFDYLAPIIDLSTVTRSMELLSLKVQRETNSCSSQEREAILSLHDTLPQVVKASVLYYKKTIYNNHIAKINQEKQYNLTITVTLWANKIDPAPPPHYNYMYNNTMT